MVEGRYAEELASVPKAKKGPPRWMVLTGCGCLIPGFIVVATMAWFLQLYSGLVNKETAWTSLGELVAYDESARGELTGEEDNPRTPVDESRIPGEFELLMGGEVPFSSGVETYWFGRGIPLPTDEDQSFGPDPLAISILKLDETQSDKAAMAPAGTPMHEDRTYEIQGKILRGRVVPEMVNDQLQATITGLGEVRGAGAVIWLREGFTDPEEPDKRFDLMIFFQRPSSSEPIEDEEIERFLEPFDLSEFPSVSEEDPTEDPTEDDADAAGVPTPEPEKSK